MGDIKTFDDVLSSLTQKDFSAAFVKAKSEEQGVTPPKGIPQYLHDKGYRFSRGRWYMPSNDRRKWI